MLDRDRSRFMPFRSGALTLMIGAAVVMAFLTLGVEKKVRLNALPPNPPDHLSLDDYVVGVTRTLGEGKGAERLTPAQAQRLLQGKDLIRRDLYAQMQASSSTALALFESVLTDGQETAIARHPARNNPGVLDPSRALSTLFELLTQRAQGS